VELLHAPFIQLMPLQMRGKPKFRTIKIRNWKKDPTMKPLPVNVYREALVSPNSEQQVMHRLVIFLAACTILYFGKDIIVPVVLALLLSLLLNPAVRFLQNWRTPKLIAVICVVVITFATLVMLATVMGGTLARLAQDLPNFQMSLLEKAKSIKFATSGGNTFTKAANVLQNLQTELAQDPGTSALVKPIPVEIRGSDYGPLGPVATVITTVAHPLAQLGIVFLMLSFVLYNREDLRNRLVKLAGLSEINRTTVALDEAGVRLSKLFTAQLLINSGTGIIIAIALFFMGIPGAVLWGLLIIVMRFVPYIGTILSAIFPVAIALAVGDGWSLAIATLSMILVVEIIVGQVIEPLLFGHMAGLSPVAVVLAAAFWTAVWGPIGLVLATPLTICLLVLGKNIESLNFIEVMLGSETEINPESLFYQRMLAADPLEAVEQAEPLQMDGKLDEFLDSVAVPGLMMAYQDQQREVLTKAQAATIANTFSETLDELWDDAEAPHETHAKIVLVPAYGALNFCAALALSALLKLKNVPHVMLDETALSPRKEQEIPRTAESLAICYLVAPSSSQQKYMVRRAQNRWKIQDIQTIAWRNLSADSAIKSAIDFASVAQPLPASGLAA
jgi:predicted PurR-regulated permease PerM